MFNACDFQEDAGHSGLPPSATNAALHMPEGLGIKSLTHLYKECHSIAYVSSMIKADKKVKNCLESKRLRELSWKKKFSITNYAHNLLTQAQNDIQPQLNAKQTLKTVKSKVKTSIAQEIKELWNDKLSTLVKQGNLLKLLAEEKSNITWKSIIHNLPRKVLKFGLNSITDTLPVNSNLALWGKTLNQNCSLCGKRETLLHVLNGCTIMLEQGRYTYRHNSVLSILLQNLSEMYSNHPGHYKIYSDIEGRHALGGGTIPPSILCTNEKPDIVIVTPEKLVIIELSIPFESNIKIRHEYKCNKYSMLVSDLKQCGQNVSFFAIEVGSRGYVSEDNKNSLKEVFNKLSPKMLKNVTQNVSRQALVASFIIFFAKYSKDWCSDNM